MTRDIFTSPETPCYCVMFNPATQLVTSSCASGTLFLEIESPPSTTVALGCSAWMVWMVLENPLPPWVVKGTMVLPLKSYCSKKVYNGIGKSEFQLGYPKKITS